MAENTMVPKEELMKALNEVLELRNESKFLKETISKLKKENELFQETINQLSSDKDSVDAKYQEIIRIEAGLKPKEKALTEERAAFEKKKAEIEARELAVSSQEKAFNAIKDSLLKASEELAEKKTQLFLDAEKLASELHDKRISETEKEVQKLRDEASRSADQVRSEAQTEKERIIKEANKEAQEIIDKAKSDTNELERQIAELQEKNALLSGENTKLDASNRELSEDKRNLSGLLENQKNEYDKNLAEQIKLVGEFTTLQEQLKACGKDVKTLSDEILAMNAREQELNSRQDTLESDTKKLKDNQERLENKKQELDEKETKIEEKIKERYGDNIKYKDDEIERLKEENENLRNSFSSQNTLITQFKDLKAELGENPAEILLDYQQVKAELALALEKVQNTPSQTLQKTAADLQEKENALNEREKELKRKDEDNRNLFNDYAKVQVENEELHLLNKTLKEENTFIKEQRDRLLATYETPAARDERINEIKKPFITELPGRMKTNNLTEIRWLNGINKKIEDYGLKFSRRILYAFHTALKNSEMSPLTVLAGVSGTGKSELPRLYSHFGGINFLSVPVQPNWDCQESMLGYYNSIDNCFEATNILRLLAQSQRKLSDQTGLKDFMTMILLDEMNLANVELYFAEFLSKLETRRGLSDEDVPKLGVKIGSKMEDWKLDLGRNVLWTGTMNNDETTKTLSDKVLDRGIVISFPRPDKLRSRGNKQLGAPSPLLPRSEWKSWIENAYSFKNEEIEDYKETVEEINEQLGRAGRALGHRVWQSIEAYMSLYPAVIDAQKDSDRKRAMDIAFEDQLVQKVMPKLRGLETSGTQAKVLEAIETIIRDKDKATEAFHNDFKNAMEQNYGQFIWTTSTYLLKDNLPEQNDEEAPEEIFVGEKIEKPAQTELAESKDIKTKVAKESEAISSTEATYLNNDMPEEVSEKPKENTPTKSTDLNDHISEEVSEDPDVARALDAYEKGILKSITMNALAKFFGNSISPDRLREVLKKLQDIINNKG